MVSRYFTKREGIFKNDRLNGQGKIIYSDGEVESLEGNFKYHILSG